VRVIVENKVVHFYGTPCSVLIFTSNMQAMIIKFMQKNNQNHTRTTGTTPEFTGFLHNIQQQCCPIWWKIILCLFHEREQTIQVWFRKALRVDTLQLQGTVSITWPLHKEYIRICSSQHPHKMYTSRKILIVDVVKISNVFEGLCWTYCQKIDTWLCEKWQKYYWLLAKTNRFGKLGLILQTSEGTVSLGFVLVSR